jgi:hypothetical protein
MHPGMQRFHGFQMERLNLKKLNLEVEGRAQYYIDVSNSFTALEDLDSGVEINSAWEMIREI